jgi:pyruvate,orthophosphate dikinase
MSAYVFHFGGGARNDDPRAKDKTITGGKGANLAEMAGIGLPVPPGFTISTEVCAQYNTAGKQFDADIKAGVAAGLVAYRERHGPRVRRCRQSAAGLGALGRACRCPA